MTATGTVHFNEAHVPRNDQAQRPAGGTHFTQVATAVLRGRGLGLSPWAKLLYVVLRSYADPAGGCYPGYATLQTDVGCGINQLTRAMRELETAGLVTRRRRGQGHPTRYIVHAPSTSAPDRAPGVSLIHSRSESRLTAGVNQESLSEGVEQDSGNIDPGEQHHQEPPTPLAPTTNAVHDSTSAVDDDALLAALISRGITPRVAQSLCTTHDAQVIREQLAWYPYRSLAKNPAGALVQAIRERWPAPLTWVEVQEHAASAVRQAEEARRRLEAEEARRQEWAAKPSEERIAGRLQFWFLGQRRKGREPTETEVAARRAELLAELAGRVGPMAVAGSPDPGLRP
jgi:hypothetical protein